MEKKSKHIKLTDHFNYLIFDNTLYLFQNEINVTLEEIRIVFKKVALLIEDYDISYINISAKKIEERKKFYQDFGFTLSFYDVNKLNELYSGKKNKIDYKCYGLMTKSDFLSKMNEEKEKSVNETIVVKSNSGYVSNLLLLFFGISFLCFLCVQGAIILVR